MGEDEVLGLVEQLIGNADVVFISCTNLPTVHLIDKIEKKHGISVVTSNQALLYAALKEFEIDNVEGYGRLFSI